MNINLNPEFAIRTTNSSYGSDDAVIDVAGTYAFTVRNTGAVKAFLLESMELLPGQQVPFENVMGLPFASNIPLSFQDVVGEKRLEVIKFTLVKNPNPKC